MKTNFLLPLAVVGQVSLLVSCYTPHVQSVSQPLSASSGTGALVNSKKLTPETASFLKKQNLEAVYRRDPAEAISTLRERSDIGNSSSEARLALIELCSDTGDRIARSRPKAAAGYHLAAAELAYEGALADASRGTRTLAPVTLAYNHSAGRVAKILSRSSHDWGKTTSFEGPWKTYRFRCRWDRDSLVNPAWFDSLESVEYLKLKHYDIDHVRRKGIGAAMVGYRKGTKERREENSFLSPIGMALPLNATLEYRDDDKDVELKFADLTLEEKTRLGGQDLAMAADYTTTLATLVDADEDRKAGFKAMLHPDAYLDHSGLYLLEPFRADKIPVIFVHGLMSSPHVWVEAINRLRADPVLRRHYQPLVFRYSTGFPILYNIAALRKRLRDFQRQYDPNRSNSNMRRMILIGHSMGGILSNAQVRGSGDAFIGRFFTKPIDELDDLSEEQKLTLKELMKYEPNPDIARAIFLAAPHRGSKIAKSPFGSLGRKLLKYPGGLITEGPLEGIDGMTELGRAVVKDRPDSIAGLKPDSPVLLGVMDNPPRVGVELHSIIGQHNPKKPLDKSGDKVVPYLSAKLDEAMSEKIVEATHTTICQKQEAIEEVRRILYVHVGEAPPR